LDSISTVWCLGSAALVVIIIMSQPCVGMLMAVQTIHLPSLLAPKGPEACSRSSQAYTTGMCGAAPPGSRESITRSLRAESQAMSGSAPSLSLNDMSAWRWPHVGLSPLCTQTHRHTHTRLESTGFRAAQQHPLLGHCAGWLMRSPGTDTDVI